MARQSFDGWMTEEKSSTVMTRIAETSAVEALGRHEPMKYNTKSFNRSGGVSVSVVPKGTAYPEDVHTNDDIDITAVKFGTIVRIAEEDLDDSPSEILNTKKSEWGTSYGRKFDNASIAVTAARTGGDDVPFTSLYKALSTTNAATAYTANANITKTAGVLTYDQIVDLFGIYEEGRYADEAKTFLMAHPSFKRSLRKLKTTSGDLIFQPGNIAVGTPDTIFGAPIKWSNGLKTSATATDAPAGNPLLVVGNRDLMIVGDRTPVESVFIDGRDGASTTTDESLLKMRTRKAFGIGYEQGFSILEVTAA